MATLHILGDDKKWYYLECYLKNHEWYTVDGDHHIPKTQIYWVN